jgi:hypothetical protein
MTTITNITITSTVITITIITTAIVTVTIAIFTITTPMLPPSINLTITSITFITRIPAVV